MLPIHYVDPGSRDQKTKVLVETKRPSGYEATPEYHPTMVAVRCLGCGGVGIVEFVNGFDLKKGDALMQGKPVRGTCLACAKETEFVPVKHAIGESANAKLLHEYKIAAALDYAASQRYTVGPNALILPVEKQKEHERRIAESA